MLNLRLPNLRSFLLLLIGLSGYMGAARADGDACGNAKAPCRHPLKKFAPYEISFRLPQTIKPNTDYKSTPFYAVVLWSRPISEDDACDAGQASRKLETERHAVQVKFPTRKVFAGQQCPDMDAVSYIVDGKTSSARLLAIYGGTEQEARAVLAKAKPRYPEARVQRVQAVWQRIMQ
jgi:hypothetical protein